MITCVDNWFILGEGAISKEEYQEKIVPVKTPVGELCNAFLVWTFEVCSKLYNIETLCP